MRWNLLLLLALLFFIFSYFTLAEPVFSANIVENYWVTKPPMQEARGSFGVVAVNGKIYAIGGSNGTFPNGTSIFVGTNEEYDPIANEWTFKKPMPTARPPFCVVELQNNVYCIGGHLNYEIITGVNEAYNPSADIWETKASMPTPRGSFVAVVFQNKVYCIGGYLSNGSITGINEVYDPLTDTWETKTSMPTPRVGLKANVANGKIYFIGGHIPQSQSLNHTVTPLSVNEAYNPETDSWTTLASLPYGTSGTSIVFENKIYVFAGIYENLTIENVNMIYNPETDKWSQSTIPKSFIANGEAVATTGANASRRVYVLAEDFDTKGQPFRLHVYDPASDTWAEGAALPTWRRGFGLVVLDDLVYAIGGYRAVYNSSIPFDWSSSYLEFFAANEQYTPFGYGTPDPSYTSSPGTSESTPFPTVPVVTALLALIPIVSAGLLIHSKRKQKGASVGNRK
jgi:N-acetylneuraminic acid mutarotase